MCAGRLVLHHREDVARHICGRPSPLSRVLVMS